MKKRKINYLFIFIILFLGIGFAIINTHLSTLAYFNISDGEFKVYIAEANVYKTFMDDVTIDVTDYELVDISCNFKKPGDFATFGIQMFNEGTIDAKLSDISTTGLDGYADYITIDAKYVDGSSVLDGDLLLAGESKKILFTITYNYDVDTFLTVSNINIQSSFSYVQNDKQVSNSMTTWDYKYNDYPYIFYPPVTGTYKLETWGAQGGNLVVNTGFAFHPGYDFSLTGGYGGYTVGEVRLYRGVPVYIYTGGAGTMNANQEDYLPYGFNGGPDFSIDDSNMNAIATGGGATHIATVPGKIYELEENVDDILMVAGGGGGSWYYTMDIRTTIVGHGGGYKGSSAQEHEDWGTGSAHDNDFPGGIADPSQSSCTFGYGTNYGGAGLCGSTGGGGSGYIGPLKKAAMYCYNCEEFTDLSIKTISTSNVSEEAISGYAKIGNGHARITLLD